MNYLFQARGRTGWFEVVARAKALFFFMSGFVPVGLIAVSPYRGYLDSDLSVLSPLTLFISTPAVRHRFSSLELRCIAYGSARTSLLA